MNWIERVISDSLSKVHNEAALSDPWVRQTARLRILRDLSRSNRLGKAKLREVKDAFRKEFDEYIISGSLEPRRPTWDPDGRESILYHYRRLLALTLAIELASDRFSTKVAEAIREESSALCQSYFRWCDHIVDIWGESIHRTPH